MTRDTNRALARSTAVVVLLLASLLGFTSQATAHPTPGGQSSFLPTDNQFALQARRETAPHQSDPRRGAGSGAVWWEVHTYFVAAKNGAPAVWVHNNSRSGVAKWLGDSLRLRRTHIFKGERIRGALKGFHLQSANPANTIVSMLSPATAASKGVYEARWLGFGKTGLGKPSTFFPATWSIAKTEEAIRRAAGSAGMRNAFELTSQGKRWKFSAVVDGIEIEGYLSRSRKTIMTAYPVYK